MVNRQALIGLIGANITKSLAPALHIDAFVAAGITGHYHLMDVDRLPGRTLKTLLDAVTPEARQIGAVNTVTIAPDGSTMGYNTDRSGFRLNFEDGLGREGAESKTAVLVGAGGAGSAVAFALMDLGLKTLIVHDMDGARAATLTADVNKHFGAGRSRISTRLGDDIAAADGVVNATPIGMSGFPGNPVPVDALRAGHWVADVIYSPIETELIRAARARGARVVTGGGMCVWQGVDAFRLFTGIAPDAARMHRVFASALAARDRALAGVS